MSDKVRRQKDLISRTIDKYKSTTLTDYAKYFEGSPTYITYYQLDMDATKQDTNLENVHSLVGSSTPNKYKLIHDVVIYGVDALSVSNEISEKGLQSLISGDFVLLPDSIRPYPGDFFKFDDLELQEHLFRVNDVQYDKASPRKFFRCQYSLWQDNSNILGEQTPEGTYKNVSDEFVLDYDSIGGETSAIIKKADAAVADKIKLMVDGLIERYMTLFYDEDMDTFTFKYPGEAIATGYNSSSSTLVAGQPVHSVGVSNDGWYGIMPLSIGDSKNQLFGTVINDIGPNNTGQITLAQPTMINLWSPYLQKFIHNHKVMEKYESEFMKEIYINDINESTDRGVFSDVAYYNSIFRKVEILEPLTFENTFMNVNLGFNLRNSRNLPFFHGTQDYKILQVNTNALAYRESFHLIYQTQDNPLSLLEAKYRIVNPNPGQEIQINSDEYLVGDLIYEVTGFGEPLGVYRKINSNLTGSLIPVGFNEPLDLTGEVLYNIISRYSISDKADPRYLVVSVELLTQVNSLLLISSLKNYILMPIVIHILKERVKSST
jgi:hypothetical protein